MPTLSNTDISYLQRIMDKSKLSPEVDSEHYCILQKNIREDIQDNLIVGKKDLEDILIEVKRCNPSSQLLIKLIMSDEVPVETQLLLISFPVVSKRFAALSNASQIEECEEHLTPSSSITQEVDISEQATQPECTDIITQQEDTSPNQEDTSLVQSNNCEELISDQSVPQDNQPNRWYTQTDNKETHSDQHNWSYLQQDQQIDEHSQTNEESTTPNKENCEDIQSNDEDTQIDGDGIQPNSEETQPNSEETQPNIEYDQYDKDIQANEEDGHLNTIDTLSVNKDTSSNSENTTSNLEDTSSSDDDSNEDTQDFFSLVAAQPNISPVSQPNSEPEQQTPIQSTEDKDNTQSNSDDIQDTSSCDESQFSYYQLMASQPKTPQSSSPVQTEEHSDTCKFTLSDTSDDKASEEAYQAISNSLNRKCTSELDDMFSLLPNADTEEQNEGEHNSTQYSDEPDVEPNPAKHTDEPNSTQCQTEPVTNPNISEDLDEPVNSECSSESDIQLDVADNISEPNLSEYPIEPDTQLDNTDYLSEPSIINHQVELPIISDSNEYQDDLTAQSIQIYSVTVCEEQTLEEEHYVEQEHIKEDLIETYTHFNPLITENTEPVHNPTLQETSNTLLTLMGNLLTVTDSEKLQEISTLLVCHIGKLINYFKSTPTVLSLSTLSKELATMSSSYKSSNYPQLIYSFCQITNIISSNIENDEYITQSVTTLIDNIRKEETHGN